MATTDENGVVFYEEGDLFSPVHTALNMQGSALSAIFTTMNEKLDGITPYYRYMSRGNTTAWDSGQWTTITGLSIDGMANWPDYANGDWTVPAAGRYLVTAQLIIHGAGPGGQHTLRLYKNGGVVAQGEQVQSVSKSYDTTTSLVTQLVCEEGDVLTLKGYQSTGLRLLAYKQSATSNRFTMERIGPA